MVKVEFSNICQSMSPHLEISYDESQNMSSCVAYYEKPKVVRIPLSETVKMVLKGAKLASFFKNEKVPYAFSIPPTTDRDHFKLKIIAGKNEREIEGDDIELQQFCQVGPLSALAFSAKLLLEQEVVRVRYHELCFGHEPFLNGGKELDVRITMTDFWRYQFSNIWNLTSDLSEYIVAHALGIQKPINRDYWALWDINYKNVRIEVKSTADFHCWTEVGERPTPRVFSISKAHSTYADSSTPMTRHSHIYVFCHNVGRTAEEIYPLDVKNWDFYIINKQTIEDKCKNHKTISLNRVKALSGKKYSYDELREAIDDVIKNLP